MKQRSEIVRDPDILGGTPVFRGTRVPVQTLLDYFSGGQSLHEFLDDFPSVTHDQVVEVLSLLVSDPAPLDPDK